ncbi:ABC transporter permease [Ancylomarina euxinus]|uniref:ABC transporter permease n=1 Tax=Ancylomarina euxinus TaxID=2283627 RepID=A0A425Y585_9BACT|nr:ABC transporter permease [Ancylomarina euxinus]MCZ4694313.1 ABC transporter permease [Ancylomarina euxinus]MUP14356.1 FtsX-like permease family protein [Ancylomarina euxinus]RRG23668.1 ABC transporter permease [Ancylomarina euxinus]
MLKNFFITIIRNISRNKFYSALNMAGLSIGLICTILITLFIRDEFSYDKYNIKHERIYRIGSDFVLNGKQDRIAPSSLPMGPTFKDYFPEVEEYIRFIPSGKQQIKYNDKDFYEEGIAYTDSSLFDIFSYELIKGDPKKVLTEPNSVIINQTLTKKYFGTEDPIGKVILVDDTHKFTVKGIIKDIPSNSHFKFNILFSISTLVERDKEKHFNSLGPEAFWNFSIYTFILLKDNANIANVEKKFPLYYEKYMKEFGNQIGVDFKIVLQKIADIHLKSDLNWDAPTGNIKYIYILFAIALFILTIAGINYMNMATARSSKRAKEVGMHKVVGAQKESIIRLFLLESLTLTFSALIIAIISVELILPLFNLVVNKDLVLSIYETPDVFLFIIAITFILGIVSGSYPAFYLSAFQPAPILKGTRKIRTGNKLLRQILVICQFSVSAIMISGTIIVISQLFFLKNKDMGFNKENIIIAPVLDSSMQVNMNEFKAELKKNLNIEAVATSTFLIGFSNSKTLHLYEDQNKMKEYALNFNVIDFDYINLMKLKLMQGRAFSREIKTDSTTAFIVNQSASQKFNWGVNAIGKKLQFGVSIGEHKDIRKGTVIGVISDFHYQTLSIAIEPLSLFVSESPRHRRMIHIKIKQYKQSETLAYIQKTWNTFSPNHSFNYFFLDDKINTRFKTEERLTLMFIVFSIISILIASMGLFGLSSFMAEQRTKELGVRKILGASTGNIVYLLTREFFKLIIIANIIAIPIAYWALNIWLQDFPYRIYIHAWIFILTLIISLIIGLFTVSWQSYKAAEADPAKAIKYE